MSKYKFKICIHKKYCMASVLANYVEFYIEFSVLSYKNYKYIVKFKFQNILRMFVVLTNFIKNLKIKCLENKLCIFKYFYISIEKQSIKNDPVLNFQIFFNKVTFMEIKLKKLNFQCL